MSKEYILSNEKFLLEHIGRVCDQRFSSLQWFVNNGKDELCARFGKRYNDKFALDSSVKIEFFLFLACLRVKETDFIMKDNGDLLGLRVFTLVFDLRIKNISDYNFFNIASEVFSPLDLTVCGCEGDEAAHVCKHEENLFETKEVIHAIFNGRWTSRGNQAWQVVD